MSLQDLSSRAAVLKLYTYFEEDTYWSPWSLSNEGFWSLCLFLLSKRSCLLASASCEQLHRQTLNLQLSSSVLIFTLANPYTKQNSFNCRWWAWERERTPSISGSQVLVWDLPHRWAIWIFLLHMFNNYYGLLGFSEIQLPASKQKFCHGSEKIPHAVSIFLFFCPRAAALGERCYHVRIW